MQVPTPTNVNVEPTKLHLVESFVDNVIEPLEAPAEVVMAYEMPLTIAFVGAVEVKLTVAAKLLNVNVKFELVADA